MRKHLIPHPLFTAETFDAWLTGKLKVDQAQGCRIREVVCDGQLGGWAGIQAESDAFELALVLSPAYWGCGGEVLDEVKRWARELGHSNLLAHFPPSRPKKALAKLFGTPIGVSRIRGHAFATYRIDL